MHQRLVHKSAPYVIPPGNTAQSPVYFRVRSHPQCPCVYGWHGCIWIFLLSVRDMDTGDSVLLSAANLCCQDSLASLPFVSLSSSVPDHDHPQVHQTIRMPTKRSHAKSLCVPTAEAERFYVPEMCPCGQQGVTRTECAKCRCNPWIDTMRATFIQKGVFQKFVRGLYQSSDALVDRELTERAKPANPSFVGEHVKV